MRITSVRKHPRTKRNGVTIVRKHARKVKGAKFPTLTTPDNKKRNEYIKGFLDRKKPLGRLEHAKKRIPVDLDKRNKFEETLKKEKAKKPVSDAKVVDKKIAKVKPVEEAKVETKPATEKGFKNGNVYSDDDEINKQEASARNGGFKNLAEKQAIEKTLKPTGKFGDGSSDVEVNPKKRGERGGAGVVKTPPTEKEIAAAKERLSQGPKEAEHEKMTANQARKYYNTGILETSGNPKTKAKAASNAEPKNAFGGSGKVKSDADIVKEREKYLKGNQRTANKLQVADAMKNPAKANFSAMKGQRQQTKAPSFTDKLRDKYAAFDRQQMMSYKKTHKAEISARNNSPAGRFSKKATSGLGRFAHIVGKSANAAIQRIFGNSGE